MKQYLIVRVAKETNNSVAEWIPLPGLFTQAVAEQVIERAQDADPEGQFLIQEVGRA